MPHTDLEVGRGRELLVHALEEAYIDQGASQLTGSGDFSTLAFTWASSVASGRQCRRARAARALRGACRPRTNGKAERVIQTLLREWACARSYPSSTARARALPGYLRWYNRHRPHSSLGARPPISRVLHLCGHDT